MNNLNFNIPVLIFIIGAVLFLIAPFGLFKASADIFSGELSDKYGRRRMMILGTFIYLFGVILNSRRRIEKHGGCGF